MYVFNRKSVIDGVVHEYGSSADHLPKYLIDRFLMARLISKRKEKPIVTEQPIVTDAQIIRDEKLYNVFVAGAQLNSEPFKTQKAAKQFCDDNGFSYVII